MNKKEIFNELLQSKAGATEWEETELGKIVMKAWAVEFQRQKLSPLPLTIEAMEEFMAEHEQLLTDLGLMDGYEQLIEDARKHPWFR